MTDEERNKERRLTIIEGTLSPPDRHEPRVLYAGKYLDFKDMREALKGKLRKDYWYTISQASYKKGKLKISTEVVDLDDIKEGAPPVFNRHVSSVHLYLDSKARKALVDLLSGR